MGYEFKFIKNWRELSQNNRALTLLRLLEVGLRAADPEDAVERSMSIVNNKLRIFDKEFNLNKFTEIIVVGAGKASGRMAQALERVLGDRIDRGVVIVPKETVPKHKLKRIELWGADHPLPTQRGVEGSLKIVELLRGGHEKRLVIALFSGGGSALMPLPPQGISIEEKRETTELLLKCGARIDEVNAVRKHISRLKGGQLARLAYPSTVISLIISDVVGDKLDVIASGPTAPDTSTFKEALRVLKKYKIHNKVPKSVIGYLKRGAKGLILETPKPEDKAFNKVFNFIIASNRASLMAMAKETRALGLNYLLLTSMIEGEARHVGKVIASICKEVKVSNFPIRKPSVILAGGETTVTVIGSGRGGRNQELALSASIEIKGIEGIYIASIGSDGIDGVTDAAGAIVDGETCLRAERKGLDPDRFLLDNDSYEFFKEVGGLIYTGYTGTNVNDFIISLVT